MIKRHSRFSGIAVSPGIGVGKAHVWGISPKAKHRKIRVGQVAHELARLSKAIELSKQQLIELKSKVAQNLSIEMADIFEAHFLFLNDPVFLSKIEKKIVEQRMNVEAALEGVINESVKIYSSVEDTYLKERSHDIQDIGRRILNNLAGYNQQSLLAEESEIIIVAWELTPSHLMDLNHDTIKGLITEKGGETSHTAILARSLGIPLVSGIQKILHRIETGTPILVNGFNGEVIRNPLPNEIKSAQHEFPKLIIPDDEIEQLNALPTETLDGVKIKLMANIRSQKDINFVKHFKAECIGLYCTELAFLDRKTFPSEDQQFELYREVVECTAPNPVVFRTLDLGGDKFSPYYPYIRSRELNPYLGLRAIRISLTKPELFIKQLRAILRASAYGKVKIMIPMISGVEEIRKTKRLFYRARKELKQEKVHFDPELEFGVMIEIPSAVIAINAILREVDFISVGTNDLVQYTLAVDRSNELVSSYYEPVHPAVIDSLRKIVKAANYFNKEVSICGEMAANVRYTKLLLGLGYRNLSMSSFFIPQVKQAVRAIDLNSARILASKVLNTWEVRKIKKIIDQDCD